MGYGHLRALRGIRFELITDSRVVAALVTKDVPLGVKTWWSAFPNLTLKSPTERVSRTKTLTL